jgi:hypothetical protein
MYRCVVAGVVCAGAAPLLIQSTRTLCASGAGATHVVAVFTVLEVAHSARMDWVVCHVAWEWFSAHVHPLRTHCRVATMVYCALQIAGYLLPLLSMVLQQVALLPQVWAGLQLCTGHFCVGCL